MKKVSKSFRVFEVFNYLFLTLVALICILPFVHVLAISLSSDAAANSGAVTFFPKELSFEAYKYLAAKSEFLQSLLVSVKRVILGSIIGVGTTILCAYPLSKENNDFKARKYYVWIFIFAMLFNGGLIPTYLVVKQVGFIDTIWALVIPGAVATGNIILMLNFFRGIPKALEEAALIDGASHWTILFKVYLPLSTASIATITLFTMVGHWNDWFAPLLYMNDTANYPLATYLQNMIQASSLIKDATDPELIKQLSAIGNKTMQSAQIFLGALPILCVYPFLQKYFAKGITVGSVKG
ncbi:carbohydrate ABC transporter permease [Vagococcus sp. BWB3-3]|uniref:Carbohydrate ABC transporter permease n=1 Tax=Vagococcus allomyrinae TaxID=2794353 RepID=A0A940PBG7_9ENTE|nr:carbohydrate ABC transporter permease [Vagococcus allomyrinae]MBP1041904.1 carbohydrate ABC transporter permease [Vagococcus allomyrinae]